MLKKRKILLCLLFHYICLLELYAVSGPDRLIPTPVEYHISEGVYRLESDASDVNVVIGSDYFENKVVDLEDFAKDEAYELTVCKRGVKIEALTEKGAFRAKQALAQMRLFDVDIRHCVIFDYPRFKHRGIMIDESRSFKGKNFIKKQIDALALLRMNVLHLHLTDAAGWRIQIDGYPLLTERTAWRRGEVYHEWEALGYPFSEEGDPDAYGGYYTKDDIREIVTYAAERYIDIIPEIEMPGHSMEVNRVYPEFSCVGEDGSPRPFSWDLCAGSDKVLGFLETVFSEIAELFPYEYVHIGGDEAVKKDWTECVNCRKRMEQEGMDSKEELQGYMIRHIGKFLKEKGKKIIGWDEIIETELPDGAVVMSWRGIPGGVEASSLGHDVIMTPNTFLYLDYYQDLIKKEPRAVGHLQSLRHVYSYDPQDGIDSLYRHHIVGLQGNLWCELIPYSSHAEYMLYPRVFAIAEIGWTPQDKREFFGFRRKALALIQVFRSMGYSTFDLTGESLPAQTGRLEFNGFPLF